MIHRFEHKGEYIVLDIASGAVHSMDKLAYEICGKLSAPLTLVCPSTLLTELKKIFQEDIIQETYAEIYDLYENGLLFSIDEPFPLEKINLPETPVKALCLHVSHDCNLRCRYCFAQTGDFGMKRSLMDSETARKAIDFVIEKSANRRNIEIDFFGGEPLMAWQTVKDAVEYAKEQGALHNKNFRFTITTNGLLLNDEIIDYINQEMSNVVLSIDGRQEINDRMRPAINGGGSYDILLPKMQKLVQQRSRDKDYYVRGTYTAYNLDFCHDVLDIYKNGFDQISIEPVSAPEGCGYELSEKDLPCLQNEYWKLADKMLELEQKGEYLNFFHFNVDLEQGPCVIKRLRGCGAGCEYVAITPEGDIYPCHQFVGIKEFKMGNILDGDFNREKTASFSKISIYSREECRDCWARFYCSGGCSAANFQSNGNIDKSYKLGCELEKMRLQCAIYLAVKRAGKK